ncbi:MAG: hypothetical protein ACKV2T_20165 [Kofleriaceae bacterium]
MRWLLLIATVVAPGVAVAQYNVPAQATGGSELALDEDRSDSPIAKSDDDIELGQEVGASLDFVTRDGTSGERAFKFTDVVLFRLHTLIAVGTDTEIFAGVDLLPKQPSDTNESSWQTAMLGVRYTLNRHISVYGRGQGGAALDRDGMWVAGQAAVQTRKNLADRVLFWESAVGGEYTRLHPEENASIWNAELLVQTGLAIRERRGVFAGWLNFGFHFPLAHRGRMAVEVPGGTPMTTPRDMDPQTRVGVSLGALIGVTRGLDLFIELSILDRGDLANPTTTLPILEGGFDQRRLVFGFNRRFGSRRH